MESTTMDKLQVGWWGLFDPIYGPEKILEIHEHNLGPVLGPASDGMMKFTTVKWPVLRFRVTTERESDRYIVRFPHEPVVAMTFDSAKAHNEQAVATDGP